MTAMTHLVMLVSLLLVLGLNSRGANKTMRYIILGLLSLLLGIGHGEYIAGIGDETLPNDERKVGVTSRIAEDGSVVAALVEG